MTQAEIEALLGRSLSSVETTNFDVYLDIAQERLENLLCIRSLLPDEDSGGTALEETRFYRTWPDYDFIYVDPFTTLTSVKINDEAQEVDSYQWDFKDGDWNNLIKFSSKFSKEKEVEVTAIFGYGDPLPLELRLLLAKAFGALSKEQNSNPNVRSKRNEDFTVTYKNGDTSEWGAFKTAFKDTLTKYSQCGLGQVRHGKADKEFQDKGRW